jgi:protein O-GlcNAc transferase
VLFSLKTKEEWLGESVSLSNLKCYNEALAACEQAIRLDPNYALAYYGKSIVLNNLGKTREAEQDYEKAREFGYIG